MPWKTYNASDRRPPPLVIDILLDAAALTNNQTLVIVDEQGKRSDVKDALTFSSSDKDIQKHPVGQEIVLERWKIEIGERSAALPSLSDLNSVLPAVYKKSIVLFRSLFTYNHFLPAWKFSRHTAKHRGESRLKLKYRIVEGGANLFSIEPDPLTTPLCSSSESVINDYSFGTTDSPAGPFSVQVTYRNNCDFRVDDAEALLSSRLLATDEELFRPSLPRGESNQRPREREGHEIGSLPVHRKEFYDRPDRSQAYGSLSTFHQIGPTTGSSPISALRNAQELGPSSPRTSPTTKQSPKARPGSSHRPSLKSDDSSSTGRRPSINFQPFKAPPLSASPSLNPLYRPSQPRVSALSALKEARDMPPPTLPASANRPPPKTQEPVSVSPASNSPKPAPATRYSSSFSHRRARLSTGGTANKTDEDQSSSGKGSAASSTRKGSGQGTERGVTNSNSANDDDENISDFLKMLETKRDLLTPSDSAAVEASNRRTAAQLNRFHRIRDSTNALSESLSSSLVLQRSSSSSSRQLSSVPPMVAATSVSTSSSPGKPVSPHTPHTPAIPSRLSANSIIDYSRRSSHSQHRLSQNVPASPSEETASEVTATNPQVMSTNTFGIPIPTSPRPYVPSYRRSSSVAQRRAAADEEPIEFYGQRSASAGAEDRSQALSLGALLGQNIERESGGPAVSDQGHIDPVTNQPPVVSDRRSSLEYRKYPPLVPQQGDGANSGSASGGSSTQLPYRSRYSRGGLGRGGSGHGSSSSLITGNERGDGGSGNIERRGGGRFSFGRESRPETKYEEDEPLLFAMSDFGASRRSLEEARGGAEANAGGVRRGNQRGRGGSGGSAGMPGGFPETWD